MAKDIFSGVWNEYAIFVKNGWTAFASISLSVFIWSIYSLSITSSFLKDFKAKYSFVSIFWTNITFPKAPRPKTFNSLKSLIVIFFPFSFV